MRFITNRYIITDKTKEKLKFNFNGIEITNFLLNGKFGFNKEFFKKELKKIYPDALFFDDVDFGDFVYIDDDVIIKDGKITIHNYLLPSKKRDIINDLESLKSFLKDYKKVVCIENLNSVGIENIDIFGFLKLGDIEIKVNNKFIDIKNLNNKFVKRFKKITLKIEDKEVVIDTNIDGVAKFRYENGIFFLGDNKFYVRSYL